MHLFNHKINGKTVGAVLAVLIVFGLLITLVETNLFRGNSSDKPGVFVGVDVGYGDANAVYAVADAISGYANLIIIGSTDVPQTPHSSQKSATTSTKKASTSSCSWGSPT